ncbi:hypothetical protein B7494_g959 [Chlorociboria aeruginascens]|nr:hypothetical protein B7494_g959 [Chlorociboria aeruginascens]
MVDPDIPPSVAGNPTTEFLHWLQGGLVSSFNSTTIAGVTFFPLTNPNNVPAYESYIGPAPPNEVPHTHRYTQLLINTTLYDQSGNTSVLKSAGSAPTNFNAAQVLQNAELTVLAGNSFNVSNPDVSIGRASMA